MSAIAGIRMKNPAHPGGFVKSEIIEPLGLSVTAAAQALGVTRATLSDAPETSIRSFRPRWRLGLRRRSVFRWTRSCECRTAIISPKPASARGRSNVAPFQGLLAAAL